jgi:hypothetical protein
MGEKSRCGGQLGSNTNLHGLYLADSDRHAALGGMADDKREGMFADASTAAVPSPEGCRA